MDTVKKALLPLIAAGIAVSTFTAAAAESNETTAVLKTQPKVAEESTVSEVPDPELVKRAEAGDTNAQRELSLHYFFASFKATGEKAAELERTSKLWQKRMYETMAAREGNLESVRKRAEAGDAAAQRALGFRYRHGVGVEKNEKLALEWTKKAAEAGDAKAQFNMGCNYAGGESGVKADPAAATDWLRKALPGLQKMAESGKPMDAKPNFFAGQILISGEYLANHAVKDEELGMSYIHLAAKLGDDEATAMLGEIEFLRQQKAALKLVESVEAAAKAGDPDAKQRKVRMDAWKEKGNAIHANLKQEDEKMVKRMLFFWETMPAVEAGYKPWYFEAGKEFASGEIVPEDMKEAAKWFRLAADHGDAAAAFFLGGCYLDGSGVPKDDWRAYRLMIQSNNGGSEIARQALNALVQTFQDDAEKGDPTAQFFLGAAYENGFAVDLDYTKALKWYRKAAAQGHVGAQTHLGWALQRGQGTETDLKAAADMFRKAAEKGNPEAQLNLGRCLFYGNGCETNMQEAVSWYRKAAEQGETGAMFNLGACYMEGTGVKKDIQEAKNWFKRAASLGHERSAGMLETLQKDSAR